MSLSPFFASDTTAAFIGVVMIIVIIVATLTGLVSGCAAIALHWKVGRRTRWGLLLVLAPCLFSAFALMLSLLTQGEPTIAGFPKSRADPDLNQPSCKCAMFLTPVGKGPNGSQMRMPNEVTARDAATAPCML